MACDVTSYLKKCLSDIYLGVTTFMAFSQLRYIASMFKKQVMIMYDEKHT